MPLIVAGSRSYMSRNAAVILGAGTSAPPRPASIGDKAESVLLGVPSPDKYRDAVAVIGQGPGSPRLQPPSRPLKESSYRSRIGRRQLARSLPNWGHRILVDATSPLAAGLAGLSVGTSHLRRGGNRRRPSAARHVVKAFNTTGAENMAATAMRVGRCSCRFAGTTPKPATA